MAFVKVDVLATPATVVNALAARLALPAFDSLRRRSRAARSRPDARSGLHPVSGLLLLSARHPVGLGGACELLGERVRGVESSELFLVGLFSLLDVMLSRTMAAALEALPLSETASAALRGQSNGLRDVLDAVVSYERGEWEQATVAAGLCGFSETTLADAYTSALRWVQDVSRV